MKVIPKNNTCCGCLNTDRKLKLIDDLWAKTCFSQIISEVSADSYTSPITLCWECAALLHRFTKFKYQVLQSYKILQEYSKSNIPHQINPQRLQIQKVINIEILPSRQNESNDDQVTKVQVKTENSDIDHSEDLAVRDQDSAFSNNEEDDIALSELASKKRRKRLKRKKLNGRRVFKKRKRRKVEEEADTYTEVELTDSQIEEERKAMCQREEYVNAILKCEWCIVSFANTDDLKDHVRLKHDLYADKVKCKICECSFSTEISYNYHIRKHRRRYQCVLCDEMCKSMKSASKHYDTVHCERDEVDLSDITNLPVQSKKNGQIEDTSKQAPGFPCELCPKSFRWKTSLNKHVETHRIESGLKRTPYCEICKRTFTNTSNLSKHVKTSAKHQITLKLRKLNDTADLSSPEKLAFAEQVRSAVNGARALHACPHCGARYQWRGNLLRHLHTHTARARGELVCHPCNRTFSSIATYQQHMKGSKKHVSESDFKYMCSDCGKKFNTKTKLRDHVNWEHLKNYVHVCDTCQKVFRSHTSLYLHNQLVHKKDSAKHLCDHCGKHFPNQPKLRTHIKALHLGEAPYKCNSCPAKFTWHSCLSRHVRKVHGKNTEIKKH